MKVHKKHSFPCGMTTDEKIETCGWFFWVSIPTKAECPLHGAECVSSASQPARVARSLR